MGKAKDGVRRVQTDTNGKLALRIFIDRSSIEVFANHGETTMTSRIYPNEGRLGIELFSEKGAVKVEEFTYWTLKDIWKKAETGDYRFSAVAENVPIRGSPPEMVFVKINAVMMQDYAA